MLSLDQIEVADTDNYMMGKEHKKVLDINIKNHIDWIITVGGKTHPNLCHKCGNILRRNFSQEFVPNKKNFDLSFTYDGFLIASNKAKKVLMHDPRLNFEKISKYNLFSIDIESIPKLTVDPTASKIRYENFCNFCGRFNVVLLGISKESPPEQLPVKLEEEDTPEGILFRTDLEFGSAFQKSPVLFGKKSSELHKKLKGVWLSET